MAARGVRHVVLGGGQDGGKVAAQGPCSPGAPRAAAGVNGFSVEGLPRPGGDSGAGTIAGGDCSIAEEAS